VATVAVPVPPSSYPVTFDVEYPGELSRWLIFVKWLLAIPHYIILYFLQIAQFVVLFIAFFAILFTKKYPRGMFDFFVGVNRWNANYTAYILLLRDEYPPFSMDPGQYPVTYDVQYPEELSRWMIFVKWLLVIPNLIVAAILLLVAYLITMIAFFAILFTKKYPESLFKFVVGAFRWGQRAGAYVTLLRDEYPPFSMEP
jgi:hypothetical protein